MVLYNHINPETSKNVGDNLSTYLLEKIFNKKIDVTTNPNIEGKLLAAGSILHSAKKNDVIWGTGIRERTDIFNDKIKTLAVRGKITEYFLKKKSINCPKLYGDPALLLNKFFRPKIDKTHKFGIIPHYSDLHYTNTVNLNQDIKIITPLQSVEDFICEILSVEYILSSSLHGLILSDTYKIPNARLIISNNIKIIGSNLKFDDYYSGVNRRVKNYYVFNTNLNFDKIMYNYEINFYSEPLINSLLSYYN